MENRSFLHQADACPRLVPPPCSLGKFGERMCWGCFCCWGWPRHRCHEHWICEDWISWLGAAGLDGKHTLVPGSPGGCCSNDSHNLSPVFFVKTTAVCIPKKGVGRILPLLPAHPSPLQAGGHTWSRPCPAVHQQQAKLWRFQAPVGGDTRVLLHCIPVLPPQPQVSTARNLTAGPDRKDAPSFCVL